MAQMSAATIWVMLTGGFVAALVAALLRRDGPAALAMAGGGLLAGHCAHLPAPVLAWASIAAAVGIAAGLIGAIVNAALGGRSAATLGLALTGATLGAIASTPATASHDLARGPAAGLVLSHALATVTAGE
jgi:hypothetical protein